MTRASLFAVVAVASLAFAGCGTKSDTNDTGPSTTAPSDESSGGANDFGDDSPDSGVDGPAETGTGNVTDASADSGEAGSSSGGGFIQNPDGNSVNIECDIWAQDCMDGEKCMPWANDGGGSWNATKCSPLKPNPAQPGDPCTVEGTGVSGIDDCDISSMCWDVDAETNMGTCTAFCSGSEANPVCEDPTTQCVIANEGVLILCLPGCDPLLQECEDGQACYPVENGFVCGPDASTEMGVFGDGCEFVNVCDPGLFCANPDSVPNCAGATGCCSTYCDMSDPGASAACPGAAGGQECVAWFADGQAPPGLEDVGACAIPA